MNEMDIIRYIISVGLGLLGLYIIIMNWAILVVWLLHKKSSSTIPFFGGIFLFVAFIIIPNNSYIWLCWVAFFIDRGCIPIFIEGLIIFIQKKIRNKE